MSDNAFGNILPVPPISQRSLKYFPAPGDFIDVMFPTSFAAAIGAPTFLSKKAVTIVKVDNDKSEPKMTQFDGSSPDLALGYVTGTRAFEVDVLGRLVGVTYRDVWRPGENQAICHREIQKPAKRAFQSYRTMHFHMLYGRLLDVIGLEKSDEYEALELATIKEELWDHFVEHFGKIEGPSAIDKAVFDYQYEKMLAEERDTLPDCQHGFYGYYEGSNDYEDEDRINAIIHGYGEVVIGTRGFRAMKAKIVALQIPETIPSTIARKVRRNYADIPFFDSFDEMVSAFPPDEQFEISPQNNDDFWTQKV